jgi:hypothetical protein
MNTRIHSVGLLASSLLFSTLCFAQDSATSQALFEKGVSEMQAGRYDSACPALRESYRLEAIPGTLFALAECDAKAGRIATAVARYQDYLGLVSRMPADQKARHRDREKTARAQVADLQRRVPQMTVVLPPNAPKTVKVKRNGAELGEATLGVELPVDPGDYTLTTQIGNGPEREISVNVQPGDHKRVELELPKEREAPATSPQPPAPVSEPASTTSHHSRSLVYLSGGIGAAGILVGSVTGLMSMSKKKTVDDNCVGTVCTPDGKSAADSGKSLASISTIGFGVGLVGIATATILLLTEPKTEAPPAAARSKVVPVIASQGSQGAFVGLSGQF